MGERKKPKLRLLQGGLGRKRSKKFAYLRLPKLPPALAWSLIFVVVFAAPVGDFVNGYLTPTFGCRVIGIIDGDTVQLNCQSARATRGRIVGYDTPERFSPRCTSELARAIAATWALRWHLWTAPRIGATIVGEDRYGRALLVLTLGFERAEDKMIKGGWARAYTGGKRESWC